MTTPVLRTAIFFMGSASLPVRVACRGAGLCVNSASRTGPGRHLQQEQLYSAAEEVSLTEPVLRTVIFFMVIPAFYEE